jgi:hypothetical protein
MMHIAFTILLRYALVIALVASSVAPWASDMTHGSASSMPSPVASVVTDSSEETASDFCHDPLEAASDDNSSSMNHRNCCVDDQECQHDDCDCACPALTLVVPNRLPTSRHVPADVATTSINSRAPRNTIDTPLRPPQA